MGFANTFLGVGRLPIYTQEARSMTSLEVEAKPLMTCKLGSKVNKCLEDKGRDSSPRTSSQLLFIGLPSPLGAEVLKCATVWICPDLSLRNTYSELAFVQCALNSPWLPACCICSHRQLELFFFSHLDLKVILLLESDPDWRPIPSGLHLCDRGYKKESLLKMVGTTRALFLYPS